MCKCVEGGWGGVIKLWSGLVAKQQASVGTGKKMEGVGGHYSSNMSHWFHPQSRITFWPSPQWAVCACVYVRARVFSCARVCVCAKDTFPGWRPRGIWLAETPWSSLLLSPLTWKRTGGGGGMKEGGRGGEVKNNTVSKKQSRPTHGACLHVSVTPCNVYMLNLNVEL